MNRKRSSGRKDSRIFPQFSRSPRGAKPANARPRAGGAGEPPAQAGPIAPGTDAHELSFAILRAQEDERLRIARDLHDGVAQILGAAKLEIDRLALAARERQAVTEADLLTASARIAEAYAEVRSIATALRPPALEKVGLEPALRALVEEFAGRTGVRATFEDRGAGPRLPPEIEINLFRIAQEALANVAKHSRARSVRVELERSTEVVRLIVDDDGVGFAVRTRTPGLGLAGIRERASLLGGAARITSRRGRGTRVEIEVPLPQARRRVRSE